MARLASVHHPAGAPSALVHGHPPPRPFYPDACRTRGPASEATIRRRWGTHGISRAEYVRGLLARDLQNETPSADPSLVFDLGSSEGSDVAREKNAMLGEAVARRRRS